MYKYSLVVLLVAAPVFGVHNMLINGQDVATVTMTDSLVITGDFESPGARATVIVYADLNENGSINPGDPVVMRGVIIDGSYMDEDESENGTYKEIDRESIGIAAHFIYYAEDNGVSDEVVLIVEPFSSGYSISGKITQPANTEGIVIFLELTEGEGDLGFGTLTDASGDYTIFIPDSLGNRYYMVFPIDFLCVASGYVATAPFFGGDSVLIDGHITGYDLEFYPSDGSLSGSVKDEDDNFITMPLKLMVMDYWMSPTDTGFGIATTEASGGTYSMDVCGGSMAMLVISCVMDELWPDYLRPAGRDTMLFGGGSVTDFDLIIYNADTTITGTVYKDGVPADDIELKAEDYDYEIGSARTGTYSDGHYIMRVASEVETYDIGIPNVPEGYEVEEGWQSVAPGATGVDFHLVPVGIEEEREISKSEFRNPKLEIYPNPFTAVVSIVARGFSLAESDPERVTLRIYDLSGKLVRTLATNHLPLIPAVTWDGTNNSGERVPSGVYFCKLKIGKKMHTQKMLLVR